MTAIRNRLSLLSALCLAACAHCYAGILGVAVDPSNNISVLRVNSSGAAYANNDGTGAQSFGGPVAFIAIDPSGNPAYLHVDVTGALITTGSGGGGSGNVTGPGSSQATQIAVFTDSTGKVIGTCPVKVDSSGNFTGVGNMSMTTLTVGTINGAFTVAAGNLSAATTQLINDTSTKIATTAYVSPATIAVTEASNAATFDGSLARSFTCTLNANLTTVTLSNLLDGQAYVFALTNTASNYTVTWGNSIKWVGGTQPTQTVGAHTDVWTLVKLSSNIYGSVVQNF